MTDSTGLAPATERAASARNSTSDSLAPTSADRPLRPGTRVIGDDRDYLVVAGDEQSAAVCTVPIPLRRWVSPQWIEAETLLAKTARALDPPTAVDDWVAVDALLTTDLLTGARRQALLNDIHRSADLHVLESYTCPRGYLCVRASMIRHLKAVIHNNPSVKIRGLDFLMPDSLIHCLTENTQALRRETVSVKAGLFMANGETLSLADCHRRHWWIESRWSGRITVVAVVCESGERRYELLASRSRGRSGGIKERDWVCDCDSYLEALDIAALLRHSYARIAPELRRTGECSPHHAEH